MPKIELILFASQNGRNITSVFRLSTQSQIHGFLDDQVLRRMNICLGNWWTIVNKEPVLKRTFSKRIALPHQTQVHFGTARILAPRNCAELTSTFSKKELPANLGVSVNWLF
jgi:hypothetical protein